MSKSNRPYVLLVAGVDSGGGAGITADCLTCHDLGAWPLPVVSALTAQSLKRVSAVEAVSPQMFKTTLDTVLEDFGKPSAVKVGVITSQKILEILLETLERNLCDVPVVWDPVLCATAGGLDSCDLTLNLDRILKVATIFTPNLPEALTLSGISLEEFHDKGSKFLGKFFLDKGAKAVVVKGGHQKGGLTSEDILVTQNLNTSFVTQKFPNDGVHGGGCALSTALASLLAQGYAIEDSMLLAKSYIYRGIKEPALEIESNRPPCGHHGFDFTLDDLPKVYEDGFPKESEAFLPCPLKLGLYPVLDSPKWIERLLKLGVKTVQLRIKDRNAPHLLEDIKEAVSLGHKYNARVFIDDYYDLAIEAKAYGVHLGMEDLKVADLKKIREANLRLGVSTHGPYEMAKALQLKPSYIALGHIFPTQSKKMPSKPQGIEKLYREQRMIKDAVPTVAIGGIKLHNVLDVVKTNVGSVALITGITKAPDPDAETLKWLEIVGAGDSEA